MKIEYDSNNSGGSWWLDDKDWLALKAAGWTLHDYEYSKALHEREAAEGKGSGFDFLNMIWKKADDGTYRYMGAIATGAHKEFETPGEAMKEFEAVTGQNVSDEGCNCCGAPHSFIWGEGVKREYASGEDTLEYMFPNKPRKTLREFYEDEE